jgi:hypothetical protein
VLPDYTFACEDFEIRTTSPTLCRDHECGLELQFPAFRAGKLDAMALGLIGHGSVNGASKDSPSTS